MKIAVVVVPGLERNRVSLAPQARLQGDITTFAADASRIETEHVGLPLKQVKGIRDLYSFDMEL